MTKSNRPLIAAVAVVGALIVGFLAFGVFGIHTAFVDDKVDEDIPVFAANDAGPSGLAGDETTAEMAADMNEAMQDEGTPMKDEAGDAMPSGEIVTLFEGSFGPRSHPAEGVALVLNDGSEQRFLRFEDFATDNGPDLKVFLSDAAPDAPAADFADGIDLGTLKGNIGSQNYEIPADVDLNEYSTIVIWCQRFGVAFGVASLAPVA